MRFWRYAHGQTDRQITTVCSRTGGGVTKDACVCVDETTALEKAVPADKLRSMLQTQLEYYFSAWVLICFHPYHHSLLLCEGKKVAHTRLQSVGFRSWSRLLAVSLQVTWVINLAVGCRYFSPGLQLPSQPLRGLLPISLLGEKRHNECEQFAWDLPDSVVAAIWTQVLLCLSPAR